MRLRLRLNQENIPSIRQYRTSYGVLIMRTFPKEVMLFVFFCDFQFRTGLRKMLRRGRTTPVTTGPILGRPTGDSMVTIHRGNSVHPGNTSTQHGAKAEHVTSAKPHTSIAVAPAHNTAGRPWRRSGVFFTKRNLLNKHWSYGMD